MARTYLSHKKKTVNYPRLSKPKLQKWPEMYRPNRYTSTVWVENHTLKAQMSQLSNLYLFAYNSIQALGWYYYLLQSPSSSLSLSHPYFIHLQGNFHIKNLEQLRVHQIVQWRLRLRRRINLYVITFIPSITSTPTVYWMYQLFELGCRFVTNCCILGSCPWSNRYAFTQKLSISSFLVVLFEKDTHFGLILVTLWILRYCP